jgi:hypothetical protein
MGTAMSEATTKTVMSETKVCKHCNGTTYCGARRDHTGKLKATAACTTCVAKSALDTRVVYNLVVCSVCGGTGRDRAAGATAAAPHTPVWMYVLVSCLTVLSVASAVFSGITYKQVSNRLQEEAEAFEHQVVPRTELASDLKNKVEVGMEESKLKEELGEPDSIKLYEDANPPWSMWIYHCRDGHVWITVQQGRVQAVDVPRRK